MWSSNMQFAYTETRPRLTVVVAYGLVPIWRHSLTHLPQCRIYASLNWVSIGSDNGMSPVRRQAITWTNADLLSIGLLGTYFSEIWIGILSFSFKKMQLKMSSAKIAAILSTGRWVKDQGWPVPTTVSIRSDLNFNIWLYIPTWQIS